MKIANEPKLKICAPKYCGSGFNFQKLRYDNKNTFIEKIRLTQPVTTNLIYIAAFVTLESRGCNEDGSEAGGK